MQAVLTAAGQSRYEELSKKYDFKLIRNPSDKQKHFESLTRVCQGLFNEVKKSHGLLKNKRVKKEMQILGRALAERQDEYFDEENNKQQKDDQAKITGKMINPSDPDASWGAKSENNYFAGYKAEINLDHLYDFITAIKVMEAGHPEERGASDFLK